MAASDSTVRRTKKNKKTTPSPKPQQQQQQQTKIVLNGSTSPPTLRLNRKPKTSSASCSLMNFIARAISWYMLYTVLFQCPSDPTEDDSALCRASHGVKTTLKPHVQPYYDTYLAPHVDQYSPYAIKANADYIQPVYQNLVNTYNQYGQAYVIEGKKYAEGEYDRFLKPHVDKAQEKGNVLYKDYLGPHVETANEIWVSSKPKVVAAQHKGQEVWAGTLKPAYHVASPYIVTAYEQAKYVITVIVAPVVRDGGEKAVGWGKGLWSDVVQPQVGRIGERLGGSNGKDVSASEVSSSVFSSLSAAATQKESSSISEIIASASSKASESAAKASASGGTNTKQKLTKDAEREIIKDDLKTWTAKFDNAAEKALADLKSQIDELTDKAFHAKEKPVAKDLHNLRNTVEGGFEQLKEEIVAIVTPLSQDSTDEEKTAAQDKLFAATRKVGVQVRDQAQAIRKEAERFLAKVYDDVSEVADSNLEIIDNIHDIGVQELGMKWAWMEYVNYKDWKKFHELKKSFPDSRVKLIKSAESNAKLSEITQWVESDWEGEATEIARSAAEELKRLKSLGKKKIELADASDDFSNDYVPLVARKAEQQILKAAGNVAEAAGDAKKKVEEVLAPESSTSTPVVESIASAASAATEQVKAHVPGGVHAGFVAGAEKIIYDDVWDVVEEAEEGLGSITNNARSKMSEVSKAVSQAYANAAARGTPTQMALHERLSSQASELSSSASVLSEAAFQSASAALYGTPTPATDAMVSIATDQYSAAVAAASSILYGTPTPTHQVILESAKASYASATIAAFDAYNAARRSAATLVQPSDKPAKESLKSAAEAQYSSALSTAANSYESFTSAASAANSFYQQAVAAAEAAYTSASQAAVVHVYGVPTPTPVTDSIYSAAYASYESVKSGADSYYSAVSTDILGEAQESHEPMLAGAKEQYSSILNAAANAYSSASANVGYSAASSSAASLYSAVVAQVSSEPTPEPLLSSAAAQYWSAIEAAKAAYTSAASAASDSQPTRLSEQMLQNARDNYEAAKAQADEQYNSWVESATSMAGLAKEKYDALAQFVEDLVYGKEPTYVESVKARMSEVVYGTQTPWWQLATGTVKETVAQATDAVGGAYEQATEAVGQASEKVGVYVEQVQEAVVDAAGNVEETLESVKDKVRDEL